MGVQRLPLFDAAKRRLELWNRMRLLFKQIVMTVTDAVAPLIILVHGMGVVSWKRSISEKRLSYA